TLALSSANRLNVSVSDVDSASLTVDIHAAHGSLTLATLSGLSDVSGNDSGHVTFGGSIAAINTALDGLIYTPGANYAGTDQIEYSFDDGENQAQSVVDVKVVPVNELVANG